MRHFWASWSLNSAFYQDWEQDTAFKEWLRAHAAECYQQVGSYLGENVIHQKGSAQEMDLEAHQELEEEKESFCLHGDLSEEGDGILSSGDLKAFLLCELLQFLEKQKKFSH